MVYKPTFCILMTYMYILCFKVYHPIFICFTFPLFICSVVFWVLYILYTMFKCVFAYFVYSTHICFIFRYIFWCIQAYILYTQWRQINFLARDSCVVLKTSLYKFLLYHTCTSMNIAGILIYSKFHSSWQLSRTDLQSSSLVVTINQKVHTLPDMSKIFILPVLNKLLCSLWANRYEKRSANDSFSHILIGAA
jgi:hypothetical protein